MVLDRSVGQPGNPGDAFEALSRLCRFHGRSLLDVGCGRADLLDFLLARGITPEHYTGLEGVKVLADAAAKRKRRDSLIVHGDFIAEPHRLFTAADVVLFSGSLNTLEPAVFYRVLQAACEAAVEEVVFNFLCSPILAGAKYLHWHHTQTVRRFLEKFGGDVKVIDDYIDGDCTMCVPRQVNGILFLAAVPKARFPLQKDCKRTPSDDRQN